MLACITYYKCTGYLSITGIWALFPAPKWHYLAPKCVSKRRSRKFVHFGTKSPKKENANKKFGAWKVTKFDTFEKFQYRGQVISQKVRTKLNKIWNIYWCQPYYRRFLLPPH